MTRLGHRIRTMIAIALVVAIASGLGAVPAAAMSGPPCPMVGHTAVASPAASMGDTRPHHPSGAVPACCVLGMCWLLSALPPPPAMPIPADLPADFAPADGRVPAGLDLPPALPPPRSFV